MMDKKAQLNTRNKTILKNSIFLYFRMALSIFVGFFTVRIVLKELGVEDYGIYNVVAGSVSAFAFISNSTSTAVNRFLSHCLGQQKYEEYIHYFKNSFFLFLILSVIALLLAETIGLWFVTNKLVYPVHRYDVVIWVYESACVGLICSFLAIPFNAVIISYEKMNVFAYIGLADVFLKLAIVFLLTVLPFDNLKTYAALMMIVAFITLSMNVIAAKRFNKGVCFCIHAEKFYIKELLGFTGWNLFGSISGLFRGQGLNILINIFFGPVCNAARGIAYQVYNVINSFSTTFMMAVNPQIIKLYASEQFVECELLVSRSTRMAYSLLLFLSFPLFVLMPEILCIWLGNVPEYTVLFTRLCLVNLLIESLSIPLMTLCQATGRVKYYQMIIGSLLMLNLPISWMMFEYFNMDAYICFIVMIVINVIALTARLLILRDIANLHVRRYLQKAVLPLVYLLVICFAIYKSLYTTSALIKIPVLIMSEILISFLVLYLVFESNERKRLIQLIKSKIRK